MTPIDARSFKKHKSSLKEPIPVKMQGSNGLPRVSSLYQLNSEGGFPGNNRTFTPELGDHKRRIHPRRPSYTTIEGNRESHYNLDYPSDDEEVEKLQLDPDSRFFARERPRTLNLPKLLPYKTENAKSLAKFLSHIVSHLYIAIKTLDLQGSLSVTASDLMALKDASGISDVDMTLETSLFEINSSNKETDFEENGATYFSSENFEEGSDSEDEDEEEEELEMENDTASQHKKSPKSAAVVGVRIWTQELIVWMKMKNNMPLDLRISLIKVYYAIILSRGQRLNLKIYVKIFSLLTKNRQLLKRMNLVLPWKKLAQELEHHFPAVNLEEEEFEQKNHKQLLRVAEIASYFFEKGSLPQIYSLLGSRLTINEASLSLSNLVCLPPHFTKEGLESEDDIRHYIAALFYTWDKLHLNTSIDAHTTTIFASIAMHALFELNDNEERQEYLKLDDFGVFSQNQIKTTMKFLLKSLGIMKEKYGSTTSNFFLGYATTLIFSMIGDSALLPGGIMSQIYSLLNAIESYVHPSNNGEWSVPISKLVLGLIYQFQKRYSMEREDGGALNKLPDNVKLSDEVTDKFIMAFLPIVKTGMQSKKELDYFMSLKLLAYLNPRIVLEYFLLDIYESLEGVISTHRVSTALNVIEALARYFSSTPVFRVHVTRILLLSLPGIDSNDLGKTLLTLDIFATFANFVPYHDLTNGTGDSFLAMDFTQRHLEYLQHKMYSETEFSELFNPSKEEEIEALKSSSAAFNDLMNSFCDKLFVLFENLPDPSKVAGLEQELIEAISGYMFILFEAFSDEIFENFRKKFFNFIINNTYHRISDTVSEICGGIIKRKPKHFLEIFDSLVSKIKEDIIENEAGASRTGDDIVSRDQPLFWNLVILNECIGNAGTYVIERADELQELSFFLMENVKGPTVFATSYILNTILQSTTLIRLNECRLISPRYKEKYGITEECWGGFQFDPRRFSDDNLSFDWFVPKDKEINFAFTFFNSHVTKVLGNISNLLTGFSENKDSKSSLQFTDDLRMNFLYLGYALSGISFLMDPSFDEDIPAFSQLHNESIQERLMLLREIRKHNAKSSTGSDDIDNGILQDNLSEIVRDINSDDFSSYLVDLNKADSMDIDSIIKKVEHDHDEKSDEEEDHTKMTADLIRERILSASRSNSPTPSIDESRPMSKLGDSSLVNPSITFRERKLYTSRYYFGDDIETRKSNEIYLKLHKIRHLIGRSLHVVSKFLNQNFVDNTQLIKHFLFAVNIFFTDVGCERNLDSSYARINYSYTGGTLHINRVRKPITRIAIGTRIESYHHFRVSLHSTSRTMTKLDKILLEDVVKLSVSPYAAISKSAQKTLLDAMKRLNGSYNVIIKTSFKYLSKALQENDLKNIQSGLNIFKLRKIKSKIQNDYFNLKKYIELLYKSLLTDSIEVNEISQELFKGITGSITPPSSVCLIDDLSIELIRPPDEFIDLEIKAVKMAKDRKRAVYLEKLKELENRVIENEISNHHWKTSILNLYFLINLQLDLEVTLNPNAFKVILSRSSTDHPIITRLALKGVTKLINRIYLTQRLNFKKANAYDLDYQLTTTSIIDTKPHNNMPYTNIWKQEMQNSSNPHYFIDHKPNGGWLFWKSYMEAVTKDPCYEILLDENEKAIMACLGDNLTKEWFLSIVKLLLADNQVTPAFQISDVFFVTSLIPLMSNGFTENFNFDQLLEVISETYVKDDKGSHVVVCELISGILVGSKYLRPDLAEKRDTFISKFLKGVLENDLSPDNKNVWHIMCWWILGMTDCRRFPKIFDLFVNFKVDQDSDSAIREATRLSYIRVIIATLNSKFANPDQFLKLCFDNINHRYQAIRDQIGSIIALLSYFSYYSDALSSGSEFTMIANNHLNELYDRSKDNAFHAMVPELFATVANWRKEVEHLSPQEILQTDYYYASSTILIWLNQGLPLPQDYVESHIVPFLLSVISMKDVCLLGNLDPITVFKRVSQLPYSTRTLESIVCMLENYSESNLNVIQTVIIGEFTETLYFRNLFTFNKNQRLRIFNMTKKLIYNKNVEIRESSASTLSGLIHISPPDEIKLLVQDLISGYSKDLDNVRKKYNKVTIKHISSGDLIILHGATLGLGSLVHAFPFASPPPSWVPDILAILATKAAGLPGLVGKTAKETLGKFKKDRQDTWHIDSKVFTESQMQDLEGVLWRSYFI